jgi:hypothetical protein
MCIIGNLPVHTFFVEMRSSYTPYGKKVGVLEMRKGRPCEQVNTKCLVQDGKEEKEVLSSSGG